MNQGYGHVGRPTNEEVKTRKRKKIIKIIVPFVLILVIVVLMTSKSGLKGIMGNATYEENTEYYCENSEYTLEEDKCIKYATVESKLLGNINEDNVIDETDLELLRQIKDEEIEYTSIQYNAADVDQNGEVDEEDYKLLAVNVKDYVGTQVSNDGGTIGVVRVCPNDEDKEYELDDTVCKAVVEEVDAKEREVDEKALDENQDENEEEIKVDTSNQEQSTTYVVTLDAREGKVSKKSIKVVADKIYGSLPNPTRTGYAFKGWYTELNGKGERIKNSTKVTITEDITLYAYWEPKTYKINFNAQGGTLSEKNKQVRYNEKIIKLPKPTKKGYTFEGWYTKKNGKGTGIYSRYSYYKYAKNITLYAYYEPKEYFISYTTDFDGDYSSYCLNKSFFGDLDSYVKYGQKVKLPKNAINKCGYTFKGWYTKRNGKGKKLTSPFKYNYTKNIVIYAYFIPKTYTLKFDPQGGNISFRTKKVTFLKKIGQGPKVSKPGYIFGGWYTKKNGKGTLIVSSDEYIYTKNITLYVKWRPVKVNVMIDATIYQPFKYYVYKNIYHSMSSNKTFKSSIGNLDKISIPKGYTFKGWYTKRDGKGHRVYSNETVENIYKRASEDFGVYKNFNHYDLKIYAYIVLNKYKVSLKSNGGMDNKKYKTIDTFSVTYGSQYPKLKDLDGKQGCQFVGWYTKKNRGGKKISWKDTFKETKNTTLYAGWQC